MNVSAPRWRRWEQQLASASAAASATTATVPATPYEAIQDMIRLLKAGEHQQLIETYSHPKSLERKLKSTSIEDMTAAFTAKKSAQMLGILQQITMESATFDPELDVVAIQGLKRPLTLQRIDGRWYVQE